MHQGDTTISVDVGDGESIQYTFFVDPETGLDVDPVSGHLRTREETIENVRDVYAVGKEALGSDLERYNRWLRANPGKEEQLFPKASPRTRGTASVTDAASRSTTRPTSAAEEAIKLKVKGNEALARGDPSTAVLRYTDAIKLDSSLTVLWANRAEAWLRLKQYREALDDCDAALSEHMPHHTADERGAEKLLFRKAVALKGLNRLDDAMAIANDALKRFDGTYWGQLRSEIEAVPRLILASVVDARFRPAGSRGVCAIRSGWRVTEKNQRIGLLPASFWWCEKAIKENMPSTWSYTGQRDDRLRAIPAFLATICTDAAEHNSEQLISSVQQAAELFGAEFDIGNPASSDCELVVAIDDLSTFLLTDLFRAEIAQQSGAGSGGIVTVPSIVADSEAIAVVLLSLAALTVPRADACFDPSTGDELFVTQQLFLDHERNKAFCRPDTNDERIPFPKLRVEVEAEGSALVVRAAANPSPNCVPWLWCDSKLTVSPTPALDFSWFGTA